METVEIKRRRRESAFIKQRHLSQPAKDHWNKFSGSVLFDEIRLMLADQIASSELSDVPHLYGHEMGYREGFLACIETIRLGWVDEETPEQEDAEKVYKTFGPPVSPTNPT